ncbi:hypothetical protein TRFO_20594 [Tritrichomonas foetus]|uniref:Uncharacterized protein n=1 Tax=Tritrichomonas foetus TaxID=1144522 RepID=A0A1J4KLF1_9EUKA|nr:hypothetical protein TRFO_20594 [Tritrichomonas foetus]|eukprot:OHT10205.1 hypothetical protein TRFO_20594 [Tritrichomonas foetus]
MSNNKIIEAFKDFDFSPFYLLALSVGTILYSCGNSIRIIYGTGSFTRRPSFLQATEENQEEITGKTAVVMLLTSSIMLLILYYVLNSIILFLKCILAVSSIVSVAFVVYDWVYLFFNQFYSFSQKILSIITFLFSIFISGLWFFTEHWLPTNLMSFCLCVSGICLIKINRYQIVLITAVGFLIYDVWWVFLSPVVFGDSVMVEAATKIAPHIPAMFTIPKKVTNPYLVYLFTPDLFSESFESYVDVMNSMIGCGDIIIPGIVLDFFLRFDTLYKTSLFNASFIGYVVGVALSWIMVKVMKKGQPALLWIFPSVLIPATICAKYQKVLKILWKRGTVTNVDENGNGDEDNFENEENETNVRRIEENNHLIISSLRNQNEEPRDVSIVADDENDIHLNISLEPNEDEEIKTENENRNNDSNNVDGNLNRTDSINNNEDENNDSDIELQDI